MTTYVENNSPGKIRAGHLPDLKARRRPVEVDHEETLITDDAAEQALWALAKGDIERRGLGVVSE